MTRLAIVLLAPALFAQGMPPEQIRSAAARSVALLQKGSTGFYKAQDCFSCHHSGLPARALELARDRGIPVDEAAASASLVKGLTHTPNLTSIDQIVQANMIIDPSTPEASAMIAAQGAGLKPNLTTAIQARFIANEQRADGHWVTIDERPPQGQSQFGETALSQARKFQYPHIQAALQKAGANE